MRKIKDVLRLKLDAKLSHRQITAALGISKAAVTKYLGLAAAAGLDWASVQGVDEAALERRLLVAPERISLSLATNIQATHVPYRGNAPAVVALLSGEVQAGMLATPGLVQHFKSQRLKPLAVTGRQRSALLPDVATTTELGFPEVDLEIYYVAMVPSKTPDAVVKTLQTAIASALAQPDVQEKLRSLDIQPLTLAGQKADELLAKTRDRYAAVIKATGMKAE